MEPTAASTSSTDVTRRDPADAPSGVPLGRVLGAHGLRGELRVRVGAGEIDNWMRVPRVWLARDEGDSERSHHELEAVRLGRTGECRVTLSGVTGRDAAEALRGLAVFADATDLPALESGEYYAYELVGCRVEEADGASVGTVRQIWETGAQDLLVIDAEDGREHLVPAVEPILVSVDLPAQRIVIDPPPGLLGAPETQTETDA